MALHLIELIAQAPSREAVTVKGGGKVDHWGGGMADHRDGGSWLGRESWWQNQRM